MCSKLILKNPVVDASTAPPPLNTFAGTLPQFAPPIPGPRSDSIERPAYEDVRSLYYLSNVDHPVLNNRLNQGNGPQIFELNESLTYFHQGEESVSSYFTKLTTMWDEINQLRPRINCTCAAAAQSQDHINHDQVLQFLKGLNESYHAIRDQILLLDPCPSLNKVFSMVIHQERQRTLGHRPPPPITVAANHTSNTTPAPDTNPMANQSSKNKRARPHCTHCQKPGHYKDKCYFLHGFPPGYGKPRNNDKTTPHNRKKLMELPHLEQLISMLTHQLQPTNDASTSDGPTINNFTDNAKELTLNTFYAQQGTTNFHSCVDRPQQNAVVERKHHHILNVARALAFQSNLPLPYWSYMVKTAVYLLNRTPSVLLKDRTSFELLHKKPPEYAHLRNFGCLAYASNIQIPHKLAPRAKACIFIGYPNHMKAYTLLDIETKHIFHSRDVIFYESIYSLQGTTHNPHIDNFFSSHTSNNDQQSSNAASQPTSITPPQSFTNRQQQNQGEQSKPLLIYMITTVPHLA
uniref:Retroviral polymerase SH3-like domain-containing protein n=1 Tax=Cannabis sativa TaxID=3483 RepID=A0A803PQE3_CANSA